MGAGHSPSKGETVVHADSQEDRRTIHRVVTPPNPNGLRRTSGAPSRSTMLRGASTRPATSCANRPRSCASCGSSDAHRCTTPPSLMTRLQNSPRRPHARATPPKGTLPKSASTIIGDRSRPRYGPGQSTSRRVGFTTGSLRACLRGRWRPWRSRHRTSAASSKLAAASAAARRLWRPRLHPRRR